MKTIEAQELRFGDTVQFEGDSYHVIEAREEGDDHMFVYISPTDGLGTDRIMKFPNSFAFSEISRLQY